MADEGLVGNLVHIRLDVLSLHLCHQLQHPFFGGVGHILLLGGEYGDDEVAVAHQTLHNLVDGLCGDGRGDLVHDGVFGFDAGHGLIVDEVAHILRGILCVLCFATLVVGIL